MKNHLSFIILFLLFACNSNIQSNSEQKAEKMLPQREDSKYIMQEMKFETDIQFYLPNRAPRPYVSKWISTTNSRKDSTEVAEGKYSLKIQNDADVYYYLDAARIEGDILQFSGKYKYKNAKSGRLFFYILQRVRDESVEHPAIPDSLVINDISGNADWEEFTIKAKLKPNIYEVRFGVMPGNAGEVWIDDWDIQVDDVPVYHYVKARYPAEEDTEFDKGSGISFANMIPESYENLDVLGRVWGFLKYYHPAIIEGDINWDYELFRILPQVTYAKNKSELNQILYDWIRRLGDFPTRKYDISPQDKSLYSCFADNDWTSDEKMFTSDMIRLLDKVKNADRPEKVNYYMIPFGGGPRERNFRAEKPYNTISWEDQGFRLLTLFRFWNVMEYNFPYKYMTGKPWTDVLTEYIPEILSSDSHAGYTATLLKLVAEIDDSHGGLSLNISLKGTPAERLQYRRYPVSLTETDSGEFCVDVSYTPELKRGDVILSVDGKPVKEIYEELAPYITASNRPTQSRNLRPNILAKAGIDKPLFVKIARDGKKLSFELNKFDQGKTETVKSMEEYKKENDDILFLNVGTTLSDILVNEVKNNMSAKGIVFDLRQYPRDFMSFFKLSDVLLPDIAINLWFSTSVLNYPGHYKKYNECPLGKKNPNYYKGKVAILVNENTQSLGEMTAIALSYAPQAVVVGSTTSGADGNVTGFVLPGGLSVRYTVIGAYYPDWVPCQQTGVKIDIHARPAVQDILDGKDVLVERAIKYIRE